MTEQGDVLERFHAVLVEEIRAKRPEYLFEPFTVAEIYQELVPYATHRDRIGVDMNGDYEDALLRLLAGEGGYLRLDSDAALRRLREEIEQANPNTGLYREFAAVDVRLNPEAIERVMAGEEADDAPPAAAEPAAVSLEDLAPAAEDGDASAPAGTFPQAAVAGGPAEAPAPATEAPEACRWCRAPLPRHPNLNYCPFCGQDVHVVPCPSCGEELEPEWRFCVACGAEVTH